MKRLLAGMVGLCYLCIGGGAYAQHSHGGGGKTQPAQSSPFVIKGDLNNDGIFDAPDLQTALAIYIGAIEATSAHLERGDLQPVVGNLRGDGYIRADDLNFLLRLFLRLETIVTVRISPAKVTLTPGELRQFTAEVGGTAQVGVIWTVVEGNAGGTVTQDGLYTASNFAGTYHIMARSLTDPTAFGMADVAVSNGPVARVEVRNFAYSPDPLIIAPGTRVIWTNYDIYPHTVTSGGPGAPTGVIDSPWFGPGGTFEMTFEEPGIIPYYCIPHDFMQASIIIQSP